MLLAARRESVNVVFPWSTCPQVVIFRVVCEFTAMVERKKDRWMKGAVAEFVRHHLPLCQLNPPTPPRPPLLLETMTVLRYERRCTRLYTI